LYPICHEWRELFADYSLLVDLRRSSVHFWDPMQDRLNSTAAEALASAALSRAARMMMITTMIMTTRERGVSG